MPLTPKVYEVLQLLVQNSGHMLAKEELLKAIWPDSFVEEGNLTRNISTLRAALGENPDNHQFIETVPKRGYRFIAEVREFQDESAELLVAESTRAHSVVEEAGVSSQGAIEILHQPASHLAELPHSLSPEYIPGEIKSHKGSVALAFATLVIAIAAAVYFFYFAKGGEAIDSIAVMPLVNVSADADTEYLSDGISESIINRLSELSNLKVIALSSTKQYKGPQIDPQAVGRALNVRAVLTGKLVRRGDDLTISLELVDLRDNRHLWGGQYNRKLADIPAVQTEIAQQISEGLRLKLSGEDKKQLFKRRTENSAGYEAYLHGRFSLQNGTEAGQKTAIQYFDQAIEKDSAFAPAYVGLARVYWESRNYSYLTQRDARQKGESVLRKAIEIDDTLAEAHAVLAAFRQVDDDWPAAEKEFGRAMELNPRAWGVRGLYSRYLVAIGRNEEAVAEARRALETDPLSPSAVGGIAWISLQARQYDQAIEFFRKAIQMQPTDPRFHNNLARALVQKGMYEEAIAEFQKGIALDNSAPGRSAHLAYTFAVLGKKSEARRILDELTERAKQSGVAPGNFAIIHTGLGEKDQAFAWLEKTFKDRSGPPYTQIDPVLDGLRSDPRFADLAKRKGLAP